MPQDNSIYFKQESPDIVGSIQRGMTMGDQIRQRKKQRAVNDAYSKGVITNPDGSTSFDQGKTLAALAGVGGQEYLEGNAKFNEQDVAARKAQRDQLQFEANEISNIAGTIKDQRSYEQGLGYLKSRGIDVSQMPQAYDPGLVNRYAMGALTAKERLEQENKSREFSLKQQELWIKNRESMQKMASGENMPIDTKKEIEGLASKNASKRSIKNQLDGFLSTWDNLSEDQKIIQGRQLLKTLNSPEGADAIGAEEAKRLGGLLEFKMFNVRDPGSMFGRDVEEFKTQVANTSNSLGKGLENNQARIDELYGRAPKQVSGREQDVEKYAQAHGISYDQALNIKKSRMSTVGKK